MDRGESRRKKKSKFKDKKGNPYKKGGKFRTKVGKGVIK
jgi:hypothetical protein